MAQKKRRLKKQYKILFSIIGVILLVGGIFAASRMLPHNAPPQLGNIDENAAVEPDVDPTPMQGETHEVTDDPLYYEVLDVGQGQAIFINHGEIEVLIDAGDPDKGDIVVKKIKDRVDGKLDYVIATHAHEDHVGGLSAVYDTFQVGKTIYGDLQDTQCSRIFEQDAKAAGPFENDSDTIIDLGTNATLTIYDVTDNEQESNNNSVICLVQYGETYFFSSGDAEATVEKKLRTSLPSCDVVVAGHHGSKTSNTLLDILEPLYFAISAGKGNEYGHPDKEVLEFAKSCGCRMYGTWKTGDIKFTSDGMTVTCSTDKELDVEDAAA